MNRILRPLALAAGLAIGSGAHAGIPVIDNVAIAKAVQQVAAWGKQYEQMAAQIQEAQKQLQQLETTYQSMTGSRGLGSLLANPGLPQFLPDEWKTVTRQPPVAATRASRAPCRRSSPTRNWRAR